MPGTWRAKKPRRAGWLDASSALSSASTPAAEAPRAASEPSAVRPFVTVA